MAAAAPAKQPSPHSPVAAHVPPAKSAAKTAPVKTAKAAAPAASVARLGRGYKLYLDGEYAAAAKELSAIQPSTMQNVDYVLYLLATSQLLSGDASSALVNFRQLSSLSSRFAVVARWRIADCLWAAGELENARKQYELMLGNVTAEVEPAVARFRIGEALAKKSGPAAALAQWRKVYVSEPLHPLAEVALARLTAAGAPPITPEERITRAKILTNNRAWPRALEELALVPDNISQPLRDEADYWIGTTKFHMRRDYDIAAKKLLSIWPRLPGDDRKAEALFHGAQAWSRANDDDAGQNGYRDLINRFPHSKYSPEASFKIGWLDFNRGKYKEAIPSLEETLRKYGSSTFNDDARWFLGFSRWLSGDIKGALNDFETLSKMPGALSGGKGAYWKARALDILNRQDDARKTWRNLVDEYPFSYYALEARARLKERGVMVGPFGDASRGSPPQLAELDRALGDDAVIRRVDELLAAGLTVEAGFELRRGEGELMKRYGSARALPLLFDRYLKADNFNRPHQLAETYSGAALKMDPNVDSTVRKWWETVYPRAYREYVEKYSPSGDNPPYYLYTIMQKESAYNPHDVSYADAIGLLQMIPPTSRRVALRIESAYTDDVLYDPEGNIRFGAWYIGHLLQKFKGQIPLGAGSYNAGPKAMMKWVKMHGDHPLDEFIELTPYVQTREYMKKVLDIYSRYLYLYEKQDYIPDTKVDLSFLENDIDY